ncbi:MAG TPA: hypothetical protein VGO59_05295 [Verrucomicrobiae bacterium]
MILQAGNNEQIPCSSEWITFELLGEGAEMVDPEMVRHASAAVLHYFKHELRRTTVSVGEFAQALEKVLRSFGLSVQATAQSESAAQPEAPKVLEFNLTELARNAASEGFELLFFPQLRQELKRNLDRSPAVLRFHNLRDCVKQLQGARRWSGRCQKLHDHIVEFLRSCWETDPARRGCALLVV